MIQLCGSASRAPLCGRGRGAGRGKSMLARRKAKRETVTSTRVGIDRGGQCRQHRTGESTVCKDVDAHGFLIACAVHALAGGSTRRRAPTSLRRMTPAG